MRLVPAQVEALPASIFILLVGSAFGVLRCVPAFLLVHTTANAALAADALVGLVSLLIFWTIVRRRQYNIWRSAAQALVVYGLGGAIAVVLTHPIADAIMPMPLSRMLGITIGAMLLFSPVYLVVAAILIHLARFIPGTGRNSTLGAQVI